MIKKSFKYVIKLFSFFFSYLQITASEVFSIFIKSMLCVIEYVFYYSTTRILLFYKSDRQNYILFPNSKPVLLIVIFFKMIGRCGV